MKKTNLYIKILPEGKVTELKALSRWWRGVGTEGRHSSIKETWRWMLRQPPSLCHQPMAA